MVSYADKTLTCKECGMEFQFTAGEQEFYQKRGLQHEPGRCPECRAARRKARGQETGASRPTFTTVCASCGQEAVVPFEPRLGRPVYCSDCFAQQRA